MARTIQDIYDGMVAQGIKLATDANLPDLVTVFNSTSKVAVWKIVFYAVAFAINVLETLFDYFRIETDDKISRLKPGSDRWYVEMAKKFEYGYNLFGDNDYYDNTGLTEAQVTASLIVAYAAAVEQDRGMRIKVAKLVGGDLAPLSVQELNSFSAYMARVKYAGIKLLITSTVADDLNATLRVYYNPLVLDATGARIDGTSSQPVQNALNTYLKNLPFNGLFAPSKAVDVLQAVDGVELIKDDNWSTRYGALAYTGIDVEVTPDSGYLRLAVGGLSIQFIPHGPI